MRRKKTKNNDVIKNKKRGNERPLELENSTYCKQNLNLIQNKSDVQIGP